MALVFAWLWLTVHVNYAGNWTALYCTGALHGMPASLAAEHIWQFPDSNGYDGQTYHYIAHDPWMRDPGLTASVDNPRLRYRRILVPALAWVVAMGRPAWIDPAYYAIILLWIGAGVYWTAAFCRDSGRAAAWGLLFLCVPATLIAMDRMTVDVALAALTVAFAYYLRRLSWRLFVVLAAAMLARETGALLLAGYCGSLLWERRIARAAWFSLAALPAFAWFAFVHRHTPSEQFTLHTTIIPLAAIWANIAHPFVYPPRVHLAWLATACDYVALSGALIAVALGCWWNLRRQPDGVSLCILCFAAMAVFLQPYEHWSHVYNYGRIYSPLLILLPLQRRSWSALLPLLLMLPRIGMQFGNQILGLFGVPR
jgi:hypothetical protein